MSESSVIPRLPHLLKLPSKPQAWSSCQLLEQLNLHPGSPSVHSALQAHITNSILGLMCPPMPPGSSFAFSHYSMLLDLTAIIPKQMSVHTQI